MRPGSKWSAVWRPRLLTLAQRGVKVMQSCHKIVFTCDFHRTSLFSVPPFSELVCKIRQPGNVSVLMGVMGSRQNKMNTEKGV